MPALHPEQDWGCCCYDEARENFSTYPRNRSSIPNGSQFLTTSESGAEVSRHKHQGLHCTAQETGLGSSISAGSQSCLPLPTHLSPGPPSTHNPPTSWAQGSLCTWIALAVWIEVNCTLRELAGLGNWCIDASTGSHPPSTETYTFVNQTGLCPNYLYVVQEPITAWNLKHLAGFSMHCLSSGAPMFTLFQGNYQPFAVRTGQSQWNAPFHCSLPATMLNQSPCLVCVFSVTKIDFGV